MGQYDSIDLDWTWDGDYMVGNDGDIKDTSDDLLKSIETEVATIVKSDALDWEKDPFIGASLSDFVGEANKRETGKRIEERVLLALGAADILQTGDLEVKVVPISAHQVMIMITIYTYWSSGNRLSAGEPISVNLVFDTMERDLFFFPPPGERF